MFPSACCFMQELGLCQSCDLIDEQQRQDLKEEWDEATAEDRTELSQTSGVNTWNHAFTGVPCVSQVLPASIVPFDFMHCAAEGMLKVEVAAFFFVAIKRNKWFKWADVRRVWDAYSWPKEHGKPPFPTDTFLEGRRLDGKIGSFPKKSIHVQWTAAQVTYMVKPTQSKPRAFPQAA